jgi:hypothetical protein
MQETQIEGSDRWDNEEDEEEEDDNNNDGNEL